MLSGCLGPFRVSAPPRLPLLNFVLVAAVVVFVIIAIIITIKVTGPVFVVDAIFSTVFNCLYFMFM